jgi:hypothetical protein
MPTRPTISRRTLLASGLAAAAALAGGAHHWRRWRHPNHADLAGLIRWRLGHLRLDPGAAETFAAEYVKRYGARSMSVYHHQTVAGLFRSDAMRRWLPAGRVQDIRTFERRIVSYFLRSSTYFRSPPGTVVRFVGFPDPYEVSCTNPFANLNL